MASIVTETTWGPERIETHLIGPANAKFTEVIKQRLERIKSFQVIKDRSKLLLYIPNIQFYKDNEDNPDVFLLHLEHFFDTNPPLGRDLGIVVWVIFHPENPQFGGSHPWMEARVQGNPEMPIAIKHWGNWSISEEE
jgi:hypothetical protein